MQSTGFHLADCLEKQLGTETERALAANPGPLGEFRQAVQRAICDVLIAGRPDYLTADLAVTVAGASGESARNRRLGLVSSADETMICRHNRSVSVTNLQHVDRFRQP
jgi:hypothetical protein